MESLEQISQRVAALEARNKRVEADKAWEESVLRKGVITLLTYLTIVLFFIVANLGNAFINAIVPTIGFVLSTLSLSMIRRWWNRVQ